MYPLTLTLDEHKAIDWIGYRYSHGDDLHDLLAITEWNHSDGDGKFWEDEGDITFDFQKEWMAWKAKELLEQDNMACFAPSLVNKFQQWIDTIV